MRMPLPLALLLCCWLTATAQQPLPPAQLIDQAYQEGQTFQTANLLSRAVEQRNDNAELEANLGDYQLLDLDPGQLRQLRRDIPANLRMAIPVLRGENIEVDLVRVDPLAADFEVYESGVPTPIEYEEGVHYRGIVRNEERSIVAISVYDEEMMGLVSSSRLGNLVIGKMGGMSGHILYNDRDLNTLRSFDCATPDGQEDYSPADLQMPVETRDAGDCIRIYFEVDDDIVQNKGGATGATNYITGLFNEVATLYANENINITLGEIFVWTQTSPYTGNSSSQLLNQFQNYRSSFDGDLAQLVSFKASGGIAVVNGLCRSSSSLKMSFASIGSSYLSVPTYSWSVMVVAHELGHLFGSQHTHACVWNGNNTAIDGCAGSTEGGCANPGIPAGGGTIMSYCHLTNAGINFNEGFGPQPGNVMRNRVAAASCLQSCSGGGGGGGGGSTCTDITLTLTLVLDAYGSETTWRLLDAQGNVVATEGPYSNGAAGTTITREICVTDGCYSFEILDAYGDGICCTYGNGSYQLVQDGGDILASGGSFGASESTDFCTNGTPPPPPPSCQGLEYSLSLTLDRYGRETTWSLKNDAGTTLYSGGPYNNNQAGTQITETFCLPDNGCFVFEILDSYGDGICCNYGDGSYALTDASGNTIVSGGSYGSGQRTDFCSGNGDPGDPPGDPGDGGGGNNCLTINFNEYGVESYGGSQDRGNQIVRDNGNELEINSNAWKAIMLDYDITPNTVLEFEFRSTLTAEIHGIGFDDDNGISSQLTFQLYGTQNWGISDYKDYPGDGQWKAYSIAVGQKYTGLANRLFFAADHDGQPRNGNSLFRNLRIHEGAGCDNLPPMVSEVRTEELPAKALKVFPNPARQHLTLQFESKVEGPVQVQVFNLLGQQVNMLTIPATEGDNQQDIIVNDLPSGAYFLRMTIGDLQREGRFQITR